MRHAWSSRAILVRSASRDFRRPVRRGWQHRSAARPSSEPSRSAVVVCRDHLSDVGCVPPRSNADRSGEIRERGNDERASSVTPEAAALPSRIEMRFRWSTPAVPSSRVQAVPASLSPISLRTVSSRMQSVINSVKGTALGVAEYLTPVLKVISVRLPEIACR